jgi:hypothetical protein
MYFHRVPCNLLFGSKLYKTDFNEFSVVLISSSKRGTKTYFWKGAREEGKIFEEYPI